MATSQRTNIVFYATANDSGGTDLFKDIERTQKVCSTGDTYTERQEIWHPVHFMHPVYVSYATKEA